MTDREITVVDLGDFRNPADVLQQVYYSRARKLKHFRTTDDRPSEADINTVLKLAGEILVESSEKSSHGAVFTCGEVVCKLYSYIDEGLYGWTMASNNPAELEALDKALMEALPRTVADEDRIPLTFWTQGPRGANCRNRKIVVPTWDTIKQNYPAEVGDSLDSLMGMKPGKSGQLIMFHGEPGTGKSYAIRALLKQWHDWCKGEYIVDPERFFGGSAEYMISVLLGNNSSYDEPIIREGSEVYGKEKKVAPWHLYIVEDGDEFLTDDAKTRSGQALSRLLNVVDGMIGQGLQVLVLVTTNEPMERIHPAVVRPGRCLANIEFRKFNRKEAGIWLNEESPTIGDEQTLAELYNTLGEVESLQLKADKPAIGFGA